MWERQGGIFGVLVLAMVAIALGLLLVFFVPVAAILATGLGMGGALSSCIPGSSGDSGEVTNALDMNTSVDDSRPVVDVLPDDLAIPENYFEAYRSAAESYGMDWEILAAVGWRETRHGTYEPGWTENDAEAMGPMQFIPAAWEHHGVYADGSSGTPPLENRNNLADAVASAANKLTDQGINADEVEALFRYNNAMWYVNQVQKQANTYRAGNYTVVDGDGGVSSAGNEDSNGFNLLPVSLNFDLECAQFSTAGMAVSEAPNEITQSAVMFALEQVGKPYCWGGTGPSCYDCSGLLYAAYKEAGIILPARISQDMWDMGPRVDESDVLPGDFIFFRVNVEGRSDAALGNPGHVGMVVGPGEMVEAWCTSCGPIEVRGWDDRDVMGFTRPLLDPRLSEHITDSSEYEAVRNEEEFEVMDVDRGPYGASGPAEMLMAPPARGFLGTRVAGRTGVH